MAGNWMFKTAKGTIEEMLTTDIKYPKRTIEGMATIHPRIGRTIPDKGRSNPKAIKKGVGGTAKILEIRETIEKYPKEWINKGMVKT